MKQAAPYAVLGLGILVMGGIAWWFGSRIDTEPAPVSGVPAPEVSEGLSIYANGVYGFLVSYPEGARVEEGYDGPWRTNALSDAEGTPVLSVTTYETTSDSSYPRSYVAKVRIGVSDDEREVRECLTSRTEQAEETLPDASISGHVFKAFSFSDAAMMQYEKGESYRIVFEGKCYAIEKIAHGSSYRDGPSQQDIPDSALEVEYQKLDAVVQGFRFAR